MATTSMRLAGKDKRAMPRKIGFTVAMLDKATCPAGKDRTWIYDARTPGLAAMITSTGAKSFYHCCKFQGSHERVRLGSFPAVSIEQARQIATKKNSDAASGINPHADRRAIRAANTLQELFDRYVKDHTSLRATAKTLITDKSRFDTCFDGWKSRKITGITSTHIRALHVQLGRDRGKITANRAIQLLRRLYGFAKIEPNPAAKGSVDFFPETKRERYLLPEEREKFFKALDAEPNETIRDFLYVSLFTGARRANVQAMKWKDISLERASWVVPASESKNAKAMTIHLPAQALQILNRRSNNGSDFVFPGHGKLGHLTEPKTAWARILKAAKIDNLHLHDLRRTLGSWMAAAGASLQFIGQQLGHRDVATTAIYSRLNIDSARAFVDVATAALMAPKPPEKPKDIYELADEGGGK